VRLPGHESLRPGGHFHGCRWKQSKQLRFGTQRDAMSSSNVRSAYGLLATTLAVHEHTSESDCDRRYSCIDSQLSFMRVTHAVRQWDDSLYGGLSEAIPILSAILESPQRHRQWIHRCKRNVEKRVALPCSRRSGTREQTDSHELSSPTRAPSKKLCAGCTRCKCDRGEYLRGGVWVCVAIQQGRVTVPDVHMRTSLPNFVDRSR